MWYLGPVGLITPPTQRSSLGYAVTYLLTRRSDVRVCTGDGAESSKAIAGNYHVEVPQLSPAQTKGKQRCSPQARLPATSAPQDSVEPTGDLSRDGDMIHLGPRPYPNRIAHEPNPARRPAVAGCSCQVRTRLGIVETSTWGRALALTSLCACTAMSGGLSAQAVPTEETHVWGRWKRPPGTVSLPKHGRARAQP